MTQNQVLLMNSSLPKYDNEWVKLILEAKNAGLTPQEVHVFLNQDKNYESVKSLNL